MGRLQGGVLGGHAWLFPIGMYPAECGWFSSSGILWIRTGRENRLPRCGYKL